MREFLKRLLIVLGYIITALIGMILLISLAVLIADKNIVVIFIIKWIIGVPIGIILVFGAINFVNWLFIEPFKNIK